MHALKAGAFFVAGFIAQLIFIITGLFVCMLPKEKSEDLGKCFTMNEGIWFPVHLPQWAWLWDNDGAGARGDKRGWYWCEYEPTLYRSDAVKYWFWLAVRNPANNFKRFILGFDIRTATIHTIYGDDYVRDDFSSTGYQLVKAGNRYHFYWVYRYGQSIQALVIELGNKFQVRHNGSTYENDHKYFKGFTFEVNPYKDIS